MGEKDPYSVNEEIESNIKRTLSAEPLETASTKSPDKEEHNHVHNTKSNNVKYIKDMSSKKNRKLYVIILIELLKLYTVISGSCYFISQSLNKYYTKVNCIVGFVYILAYLTSTWQVLSLYGAACKMTS
jgi:hypothetical protein